MLAMIGIDFDLIKMCITFCEKRIVNVMVSEFRLWLW